MRISTFLLAILLATSAYAQEFKKHTKEYKSLVVSRGIDATLVKSDSKDLKFTSHGVDPANVIVENKGDELRIKIATKALWQEMQDNHWWVKVTIPYKEITSIEALTGARIRSDEAIVTETIDLAASMGGELELRVSAQDIYFDASMGGFAELSGKTETLKVSASMGSEVDCRGLAAEYVKAKSSMGSDLSVKATKEFDGHATMGGFIQVTGSPERFYQNTGMGGDISGGKDF